MIRSYLVKLAGLNDIPAWYLLPDHRLLPQLTLRTFTVDMKWMQSLWLGALSLSGRPEMTYWLYDELYADLLGAGAIEWFFLHSDWWGVPGSGG